MTADEKRNQRLEIYRKYNSSLKGKARYARYEAKHPERQKNRWEPARNQTGREAI